MRFDNTLDNYCRRQKVITIPVFFLFLFLIGRIFQIQVLDSDQYREIARKQSESRVKLQPLRGNIYDRNGIPLTMNIEDYSFGAYTRLIKNKEEVAELFSQQFNKPREYYLKKLNSSRYFVWLERKARKEACLPILEKNIDGIVPISRSHRRYPYGEVTAHLLGITGTDNRGLSGIEYKFDGYLAGRPGWTILQMDGFGRRKRSIRYPRIPPINGHDIYLSINIDYQSILYEELQRVVSETEANKAMGVILNPRNGQILAICSYPAFNPEKPYISQYLLRNPVITELFEPGSTFKIVTAVAALDNSLVNLDDIIYCENGRITIGDRQVHDWKKFGWLTFEQIIENSSNIGVIKISRQVGKERLFYYLRKFGFGVKTGVELPGEEEGLVPPITRWDDLKTTQIAIGHGLSVTTLQLANAYQAIANGGYLLKPSVLKKIVSRDGIVLKEFEPELIRRVAGGYSIKNMKDILRRTVLFGTGKHAAIEGLGIAGKTGTAQKVVDGEYSETDFVASFVGFFPVEKPELLCAVVVDNPRGTHHTGGTVAAPVVREVFKRIVNLNDNILIAGKNSTEVNTKVEELKKPAFLHPGRLMSIFQVNSSGAFTFSKKREFSDENLVKVPDVRGLTLREALIRLQQRQLLPQVSGTGIVVSQEPAPGETVPEFSTCEIQLERRY